MSFITKLMQDAEPKVNAINNTVSTIAKRVVHANASQKLGNAGYKALVYTAGIAMVYGKPVVTGVAGLVKNSVMEVK
jgi:hypothetical protein